MILDILENAGRYAAAHPGFGKAFAFLRGAKSTGASPGRHEIDGNLVYALTSHAVGRGQSGARLEAHRRYVDIQYVLSGVDRIGWKSLQACDAGSAGYDSARDVEFLDGVPDAWMDINPGTFAVFFPEDAHAPLAGEGEIVKVVVKVAVAGHA